MSTNTPTGQQTTLTVEREAELLALMPAPLRHFLTQEAAHDFCTKEAAQMYVELRDVEKVLARYRHAQRMETLDTYGPRHPQYLN